MLALTNSFAHGATRPQARAVQRKAINATGAARPVLMATRAPRSVQMRAVSTEVETKKSKKKGERIMYRVLWGKGVSRKSAGAGALCTHATQTCAHRRGGSFVRFSLSALSLSHNQIKPLHTHRRR